MFGKKRNQARDVSTAGASNGVTAADIDKVAEQLVTFQGLVQGQRMVAVGSADSGLGKVIKEDLERRGLLEESARHHSARDRKIAELMAVYGDAVRRVPGADPQDLYTLCGLGLIQDPAAGTGRG